MTPRIRIVVLAITITCLILIARQVRKRLMRATYLLIWTALTLVTIPLIVFPGGLDTLSSWLGIYYPPATIFLASTVILFLISLHFSRQLTRLEERTRILAEELALLRVEPSPQPSAAPTQQTEGRTRKGSLEPAATEKGEPGSAFQPAGVGPHATGAAVD